MKKRIPESKRRGRDNAAILVIALIISACAPFEMLHAKEIATRKEISDGVRSGDSIYFLCDYVLSEPGSTIIPMFMYTPGKIYYDAVHIYAFDMTGKKPVRLAALRPTSSRKGRGSVRGARWAVKGSAVYALYHTGWSDAGAEMMHDLFEFNRDRGSAREVSGPEKDELIGRLFPKTGASSSAGDGIIPSSRVRYQLAGIDEDAWQLPLPTDFSALTERDCVRILVEQREDSYYCRAALRRIAPSLSDKMAREIIKSMLKHISTLPRHKQMIYRPVMEEWSARIGVLARYKNAEAAGEILRNAKAGFVDADGRTALMIAGYFNNTEMLERLIRDGAAIDARDPDGRTPLMYSIFGLAPGAMEYLLKKGADVKTASASGWTAWMFASGTDLRHGYLELTGK
ncbi:MAG TPA: ankyrin repeat domain-containing protein [Spirochaetota bacterium]|nr:ankyrin repeat domain-containing protein [Spirochaetota bacterium]